MSKHQEIKATEARFPLEKLILSPMNPRQDVPEKDIKDLAGTLWAKGMIQSLAGYTEDLDGAEIVAGGTRLRALQYLAETKPDFAKVRPELASPLVMLAPDRETAADWAKMENVVRKNLPPALEIRTFGEMRAEGKEVSAIATNFGVTEKHVYRRLALADLPDPVLDALAAQEISLSMAACFTISDDEQRSLEVLEQARGANWSDHRLKDALKPESVTTSDRRASFVGKETYVSAGGKLGGDLFTEEDLFDSPEILNQCFETALAEAAEVIKETGGWHWATPVLGSYVETWSGEFSKYERIRKVPGELSEEQDARYDELKALYREDELSEEAEAELDGLQDILNGQFTEEQKAHAGVFVYVNREGVLTVETAYVKPEDQQSAIEAGVLKPSAASAAPKKEKPAFSAKFVSDMVAIRLAATQTALLRKPEYLLDLFGFHVSPASGSRDILGLGHGWAQPNTPEISDNFVLDPRLGGERDEAAEQMLAELREMASKGQVEAFAAFREAGKKLRNGEITAFLARRFLTQKKPLMDVIMKDVGASVREVWTPSQTNCFKRLNSNQLTGILQTVLRLPDDSEALAAFKNLKKGKKAEQLHKLFNDADYQEKTGITADQKKCVDAWVPACFED
ncbi:ParB/RepB/Spo0J family partition protein [Phaeobacter piscinae]|uniref:ParB/RepB/Spo0J family partition protein n=1 Tax=Phaeobacter piscinae TaxID=1580596 RepID=UPI000BBEC96A|nr:ParB/RepB/Spo0J family partition protein [Phaeobacter piscinae]ATG41788.1 ParB/RepB/Spo0J family partition protein [Phaeobacter piscinae]AUR38211.1 ParB/RepB/Spo0J family partition protein [Phaeobacter piscinae]